MCVSNAENSLDIFVMRQPAFFLFSLKNLFSQKLTFLTAVVCLCVIHNNTKLIILILILLLIMVKRREEDDNDDKKALALKTRDTVSLEMKNNEDDIDENDEDDDDDDFMYSEMEKKALETEEEEWKTSSYKIENMQLKLYVDVLDKLCKEDKIEQFVKVFAPPDLEEEDRVYFMESLKGTMENGERWKRMKREIEILQTGKYRGISGDQERGPVEFRFDMMVDEDKEDREDNNNGKKKKKKNRNSIHIMREVVFRKTNNVWHAEG